MSSSASHSIIVLETTDQGESTKRKACAQIIKTQRSEVNAFPTSHQCSGAQTRGFSGKRSGGDSGWGGF